MMFSYSLKENISKNFSKTRNVSWKGNFSWNRIIWFVRIFLIKILNKKSSPLSRVHRFPIFLLRISVHIFVFWICGVTCFSNFRIIPNNKDFNWFRCHGLFYKYLPDDFTPDLYGLVIIKLRIEFE